MGRRIDVELTSSKEDGTWTWRAAGAKQPKGDMAASLLYEGAKVGDVVRVDADFHLDGIEVVEVFPPASKKERSNLLELKSRPFRDDELVTEQRAPRSGRGRRGERGDRGQRGTRRDGGDRRPRRDDSRGQRRSEPDRPKAKRLKPRREHRTALLAATTEEHKPIVEQLLRDGMPGVRAAIKKQNEDNVAAGRPEIEATPLLDIAEKNLSAARLAEWRDRADAALAIGDELDLRDLRSVVVAGADVARDDESKALAEQLKTLLDSRMESDHAKWLSDLRSAIQDRRVVRALRLSSRPVKAGAPLPVELANELAQQTSDSLTPETEQRRWATVLDAVAYSPVRGAVTPAGLPESPGEELIAEVRRLSDRIPAIAESFGVDPASVPKSERRGRRRRDGKDKPKSPRGDSRPQSDKSRSESKSKPRSEKGEKGKDTSAAADPKPAGTADPAPSQASGVESLPAEQETAVDASITTEEPTVVEESAPAEEPTVVEESAPVEEPTVVEESTATAQAPAIEEQTEPASESHDAPASATTDKPAPAEDGDESGWSSEPAASSDEAE